MASLESRLERLERRLASARSRKESVTMYNTGSGPFEEADRRDSLATIRASARGRAEKRHEAADINALISDMCFLSV